MAESDREKWDARYRAGPVSAGDPAWLLEFVGDLPESGRALDIAAGAGRVSIWLARRGFEVSAIDISPVGLALAREAAADEGVQIATHVTDLEREPFPEGPFDLVACFHYRQRALFPLIAANISAMSGMKETTAEMPATTPPSRNDSSHAGADTASSSHPAPDATGPSWRSCVKPFRRRK